MVLQRFQKDVKRTISWIGLTHGRVIHVHKQLCFILVVRPGCCSPSNISLALDLALNLRSFSLLMLSVWFQPVKQNGCKSSKHMQRTGNWGQNETVSVANHNMAIFQFFCPPFHTPSPLCPLSYFPAWLGNWISVVSRGPALLELSGRSEVAGQYCVIANLSLDSSGKSGEMTPRPCVCVTKTAPIRFCVDVGGRRGHPPCAVLVLVDRGRREGGEAETDILPQSFIKRWPWSVSSLTAQSTEEERCIHWHALPTLKVFPDKRLPLYDTCESALHKSL